MKNYAWVAESVCVSLGWAERDEDEGTEKEGICK